MVPFRVVLPVDSTVTRPPLPFPVALAAMRAPLAIVTVFAVSADGVPGAPVARASVAPIATVPGWLRFPPTTLTPRSFPHPFLRDRPTIPSFPPTAARQYGNEITTKRQ